MENILGREVPDFIEGYGSVKHFTGAFANLGERKKVATKIQSAVPGNRKLLSSVTEAIAKTGVKDGMTLSFHHHLRNGDQIVNLVMQAVADMGIKDIHLAASGIFACHEPLVPLIEKGVITQISVNTFNPGPVAVAISKGKLQKPAILRSHGGRPRAIESGEMHIDVAFIAAPSCDESGNLNGTRGKSACGYLSYAYSDAIYADKVVAVTDNLEPYPNCPIEIGQDLVDYVVAVDSIGDPKGIVSGTTQITTDPINLRIAKQAAKLIDKAGYVKEGMSLQTGAGGTSLAVAAEMRDYMLQRGIKGSFGSGGIHAYFVDMLKAGLFRALFDVQCFDLAAIASAAENPRHMAMSASMYGNPHNRGCVVNNLDVMLLGATEIDTAFNVNVITGSDGIILGASGGHNDCAAGAKLTVIVTNLLKGRLCVVKDSVTTVTTPGETVDALVTEWGVAVNPRRADLLRALEGSGLPVIDICELRKKGEKLTGTPKEPAFTDRIVGVVEYRDGTVIDVVRQPAG
ncbi:MAG: citrate lyase subunit alpha [Clostridiales Family XIII bacterium]|jgi:citrate lyase subunit alpha/citrate CoA-transferase|nr:citrate lyase subunit alpha [Clostridiales Family XIII bacterium]